ncbi:maleylpyruvate isomerase N-terminal domain-containing protein [Dyadobacter crusticola]|uniref:maleylpyruvate isomerase N-terminal domain-containing protein n=1 Tax=Dyadobacter crusticola TaxID=292407 RepID=UPI0004E0BB98|nr:maleylpyruvate isomerase N-terminal domain-containing protein [Dyadobacter crusticola]
MPRKIETAHLFPLLDQKLIELLKSLPAAEWDKPTVAKLWSVKDVAAHLLDGNLRVISHMRDGHLSPPDREINSYTDLVAYLNQFNADFIKSSKRLSYQLITELLEITGKQYSEIMAAQDPDIDAVFSVAWAGEQTSKNWFHIAREYTEKWHHQQQIRHATGRPGILTKELFLPFIETLLRGLPHTYRNTEAPFGTTVKITITLEEPFSWYLRKGESWEITDEVTEGEAATIVIPADTAWQLFTKALSPAEARRTIKLTGHEQLAAVTLNLIAIMG